MSACHAQAVSWFVSKNRGPLLFESMNTPDLWLNFAVYLKETYKELKNILFKARITVCKNKALAMFNQGGLSTLQVVLDALKPFYKENNTNLDQDAKELCKVLKTFLIITEFKEHGEDMASKGFIFTATIQKPLPVNNNDQELRVGSTKLGTKIMCSVETLVMSLLIETLLEYNIKVTPLCLCHDGVIVITDVI